MALIIFDRNVPDQLRKYLPNHTVRTTGEQNWSQLTNGELLDAAEAAKFDILVTADQNLSYQQNLKDRNISVVVLNTNRRSVLEAHAQKLTEAVDTARPGSYDFIRYELPPKE